MILSAESQKAVDAYLAALRKQLRLLRPEEANDIVEEIHAHILDKSTGVTAEGVVSTTLAALGTPDELAARYRTDELLKRAQVTRSPVVSLYSMARWATLSLIGLVTFVVSLAGYSVGALFVVLGVFKLLFPHNGGIWFNREPDGHSSAGFSFAGGSGGGTWTHPGHEVFRLWLAPICLAVGVLLFFLTFRVGTWCIRRFWRPSALREA